MFVVVLRFCFDVLIVLRCFETLPSISNVGCSDGIHERSPSHQRTGKKQEHLSPKKETTHSCSLFLLLFVAIKVHTQLCCLLMFVFSVTPSSLRAEEQGRGFGEGHLVQRQLRRFAGRNGSPNSKARGLKEQLLDVGWVFVW